MWGFNVFVICILDVYFMIEVCYYGQKVVVVSLDYVDNMKFVDEWLCVVLGIDGVFVMVMGYVIFLEFYVICCELMFFDYMCCYIDFFFFVELDCFDCLQVDGVVYVFGKFFIVDKVNFQMCLDYFEFCFLVMEVDGLFKDFGGILVD